MEEDFGPRLDSRGRQARRSLSKMLKKNGEIIKKLPTSPSVYIFRNDKNKIIYIGKAVNLRVRVRSYFRDSGQGTKTEELVKNIAKIEHMKTGSEVEALILEAELIKRYKPKFNVVWKDDKNYIYIKITPEDYPQVSIVRQIVDDKARYIGPYVSAGAVRGLLRYVRKIFMFRHCKNMPQKVCLQYSIGNCTGPCKEYISKAEYKRNIKQMTNLFEGKTEKVRREFEREMKQAAKGEDFERAALYRNRLNWLRKIKIVRLEEDSGQARMTRDKALVGLRNALGLGVIPKRIECYDISNIFGKAAVGSMAVFVDGVPEKNQYRRFEIKTAKRISDTDMIREVLRRRFSELKVKSEKLKVEGERDSSASVGMTRGGKKFDESFLKIPDLIIIDGGKGQLSAASKVLNEYGLKLNIVSLAKRLEEIFAVADKHGLPPKKHGKPLKFQKIILPEGSESKYFVQRIRDEAHRFAITYHRSKRGQEMVVSNLDVVDGIGPKTKKKLLKSFGSVENIRNTSVEDLMEIVGEKLARKIKETL